PDRPIACPRPRPFSPSLCHSHRPARRPLRQSLRPSAPVPHLTTGLRQSWTSELVSRLPAPVLIGSFPSFYSGADVVPNAPLHRGPLAQAALGWRDKKTREAFGSGVQHCGDQRAGLGDAIKLDESAEAWTLGLAEQHFI